MLISVLHGQGRQSTKDELDAAARGSFASLVPREETLTRSNTEPAVDDDEHQQQDGKLDWASNMRLLLLCFLGSGLFTLGTYFFPILRNIPVFGPVAAHTWLWAFNPSLAYVGQGIIMGAETTLHMLLGAIVGWGILSPLAKARGWAPGDVDDWEHGSKGWIVWISLAIMLVDAIVSLAYVAIRSVWSSNLTDSLAAILHQIREQGINCLWQGGSPNYSLLHNDDTDDSSQPRLSEDDDHTDRPQTSEGLEEQEDAPTNQRISDKLVWIGLLLSITLCVATIHFVFGDLVPLYATVISVLMALVLSIMGVRALGETDLNPVSGISKLAQLFFAFIIPQSHKSSVLINLIAGAVVRPLY